MDSPLTLERLISTPRFAAYVAECNGNQDQAVHLYHWTGILAGALLTDFRHLEILFRNRIDESLAAHVATNFPLAGEWFDDSSWVTHRWWDPEAERQLRSAFDARHVTGVKNQFHRSCLQAVLVRRISCCESRLGSAAVGGMWCLDAFDQPPVIDTTDNILCSKMLSPVASIARAQRSGQLVGCSVYPRFRQVVRAGCQQHYA